MLCVEGGTDYKPAKCVTCDQGFSFGNGRIIEYNGEICKACGMGCNICTYDFNVCKTCKEGFKLDGHECVEESLPIFMILEIVIGIILILVIVGALMYYYCVCLKKRNNSSEESQVLYNPMH